MGGGGRRRHNPRAKVKFRVVQQSYEDKDYEGAPKPVLVDAKPPPRKHAAEPICRFDDDEIPEDFTDKRNMLMPSDMARRDIRDDDDVGLFDDDDEEGAGEEREEFDENFVKELMYGDAPGDAQPEVVEDEQYPAHATKGPEEKKFDAMMREFQVDGDLDEHDPRAHGQLEVEDYAPALEAFVSDNAGNNLVSEMPLKHRGLINQLKMMSRGKRVFDTNGQGNFLLTVLGEKSSRRVEDYFIDAEGLRQQTLEQAKKGLIGVDHAEGTAADSADGGSTAPDGTKLITVEVKKGRHERPLDCMTAYSTSTRFNHPNVIVPVSSENRIKLSLKAAHRKTAELYAAQAAAAAAAGQGKGAATSRDGDITSGKLKKGGSAAAATTAVVPPSTARDDDDDDDQFEEDSNASSLGAPVDEQMIDLSVRPKNETKEEKAERRKLVKELQALRRQEKRSTKDAYKSANTQQQAGTRQSKQEKGHIPLSVVRAVTA